MFKLTLPELKLEWKSIGDPVTCFGIYHLNGDYAIHGELEISKMDKNGQIIWQQSGRDIWTTPEGENVFTIHEDYILATDWDYYRYKFDFDGNLMEESKIIKGRQK